MEQSAEIDREQKEWWRKDMEEDEKYDPVPKEPVEPEVLQLDEMGNYELVAVMTGEGQLWRNCLMRTIEIMH